MKPVYQTTTPDNQITNHIRPPHTNTTTDHRPDPTTKLDHQITPPPPIQTTSSNHPTRPQDIILDYSASNQHSIPKLLKWYRSGAFFMYGGSTPCKLFYAARCFTTIVPRLTNSHNKRAVTIVGTGSKGLCSQGKLRGDLR